MAIEPLTTGEYAWFVVRDKPNLANNESYGNASGTPAYFNLENHTIKPLSNDFEQANFRLIIADYSAFLVGDVVMNNTKTEWWTSVRPRHVIMFSTGFLIILLGLIELIRDFVNSSGLFWSNDLFLMFGGFILMLVASEFAINNPNYGK